MQQIFSHFSELLLAMHKRNEPCIPIYLVTIADENGETEIKAAFIIFFEEGHTVCHVIHLFKTKDTG